MSTKKKNLWAEIPALNTRIMQPTVQTGRKQLEGDQKGSRGKKSQKGRIPHTAGHNRVSTLSHYKLRDQEVH